MTKRQRSRKFILVLAFLTLCACVSIIALVVGPVDKEELATQVAVNRITQTSEPPPTPTPATAYLYCPDCADAGLPVNLWEKGGANRGKIIGKGQHNDEASVLEKSYDTSEDRYYYRVKVNETGTEGWVPETLLRFASQDTVEPVVTPVTETTIHVIQAGETLGTIAKKYGVTVETLAALNNIEDVNKIQVGQELIVNVPAGWTPPPTFTPLPKPTFTPQPTVAPTNTQPPPTSPPAVCVCSHNAYNCDNFATHAQAQACYDYCRSLGKGDIHRLDRDKDGIACESLP